MNPNTLIFIAALVVMPVLQGKCQPHLNDGSEGAREVVLRDQMYRQQQAAIAAQKAAEQAELQKIYSKDPWRLIGGATNHAGGDGWFEFQGLPQEIRPDGTIFKGKWGAILTVYPIGDSTRQITAQGSVGSQAYNQRTSQLASHSVFETSSSHLSYGDDIFIVANFPYPSTQPYEAMLGYESGYYTYTNSNAQTVTIHKLAYGTPCVKIWSPEEIAAANQKANAKKQAVADKVLKFNREQADKGDMFGLLRMGERYRDGDGVPKDLSKARDYLSKAAAAGSPTAADELKQLPAN